MMGFARKIASAGMANFKIRATEVSSSSESATLSASSAAPFEVATLSGTASLGALSGLAGL
eukprot:10754101-Prorocentrum_lima.AAC.1